MAIMAEPRRGPVGASTRTPLPTKLTVNFAPGYDVVAMVELLALKVCTSVQAPAVVIVPSRSCS
jgi:hypothetical protein